MRSPSIPQRIPPLRWRQPAVLWTPAALALAIAWPAALFWDDRGPLRVAIATLFIIFALALVSLGASWMMGRPPRTRRVVVLHVVTAGVVAALAAPFALTWILATVAEYEAQGAAEHFSLAMSLATTPLALMLGLPIVLASGLVFAWVALTRGAVRDDAEDCRSQVQPFR
ncbi:MAG: hypothetical protein AB7H66_07460 [Hyphomonadaceae bacterium]